MRRVEVIEGAAAQLLPHDHVAWADSGSAGFARLVHRVAATVPQDVDVMVVASLDEPGWNPFSLFADELDAGRLQVRDAQEMYRAVLSQDTALAVQLGAFDRELQAVLDNGRSALCVVADNTPMLTGSDADFERWME